MNKFINKSLLAYGVSLAILAWLLQFMQYKYHVRLLSAEWFTVIVAILFTVLGIWVGRRLTSGSKPAEFQRNKKALDYLGISKRELEVLELLARGDSNQGIADSIFVSANTVKTHLSHLYDKLGVSRRTQAVRKAKQLGLIP